MYPRIKKPTIELQKKLMQHFSNVVGRLASANEALQKDCLIDQEPEFLSVYGSTSHLTRTETEEDSANLIIQFNETTGFTMFSYVTDTEPEKYEPDVVPARSINDEAFANITKEDLATMALNFCWAMEGFCKNRPDREDIFKQLVGDYLSAEDLFISPYLDINPQEEGSESNAKLFITRLEASLG